MNKGKKGKANKEKKIKMVKKTIMVQQILLSIYLQINTEK